MVKIMRKGGKAPKVEAPPKPPPPSIGESRGLVRGFYKEVLGRDVRTDTADTEYFESLASQISGGGAAAGVRRSLFESAEYKQLEASGRGIGTGKHPSELPLPGENQAAAEAAAKERSRLASKRGASRTIATSPLGVLGAAPISKPELTSNLGGGAY